MKRVLIFLLNVFLVIVSLSGCGQTSSKAVEITADNYKDYFTVNTNAETKLPELETNNDGAILVTPSAIKTTIKVLVDAKMEMDIDSVVIKGVIDLPQKYWGRLHEQEELPIEAIIEVDNNGHGKFEGEILDLLYYSNGYTEDDFCFECSSASGTISLK